MTKCQEQLLWLLWIKCDDLKIWTHAITITKDNIGCTVGTSLLSCPDWYILSWDECIPCWWLNQPACTWGVCNTWLVNVWWICLLDTAPVWSWTVLVSWVQWSAITPIVVPACSNTQWQAITYSVIWSLPTGIVFDSNTKTFSWTYTGVCPHNSSVTMRCTDSNWLFGNTIINFAFTCPIPSLVTGIQITDWAWGSYVCWNPTLVWNQSANADTYSIVEWVTFIATGIAWTSYTIVWASTWSHTYTILPCNNNSWCNTGTNVSVNIVSCNSSPVWPWAQSYTITEWTAVNITVPACTDPDWNPLTYSMSWLPSWLSFDVNTRVITWTYTWACPTTVNATLTCSDGITSTNTSIVFTINCWVSLYQQTKCFSAWTIINSSGIDCVVWNQCISFWPVPSNPPAGSYQISVNLSWTQNNQFWLSSILQMQYVQWESMSNFVVNHGTNHWDPYIYTWTSPTFYLNWSQWAWFGLRVTWSTIPTVVLDWSSCVTLQQIS